MRGGVLLTGTFSHEGMYGSRWEASFQTRFSLTTSRVSGLQRRTPARSQTVKRSAESHFSPSCEFRWCCSKQHNGTYDSAPWLTAPQLSVPFGDSAQRSSVQYSRCTVFARDLIFHCLWSAQGVVVRTSRRAQAKVRVVRDTFFSVLARVPMLLVVDQTPCNRQVRHLAHAL